eukprot:4695686-Karenia_brevis.AAC.1
MLIFHRKHSGAFNRIHLNAFWIVLGNLARKDAARIHERSATVKFLHILPWWLCHSVRSYICKCYIWHDQGRTVSPTGYSGM